ncbi:phage terminase small subunit [Bradyrhizobium sp. i1.4.4]
MRVDDRAARYAFCAGLAIILTESGLQQQVFEMGKLRNPRWERFAVEVASMVPVERAYLAAGFRSKPEWARPNGSKLSRKPDVAARIDELRGEFTANCALSVEYLQQLLLPAAAANVVDYFETDTKGTRLKPLSSLTREQGAAISSIKFGDDGAVAELKFHPKPAAVDTLMRSIGAIREAVAHTEVNLRMGERVESAMNALGFEESKMLLTVLEDIRAEGDPDHPRTG